MKWISVEDRLPPVQKPVLCYSPKRAASSRPHVRQNAVEVSWRNYDVRDEMNGAYFHHESHNAGLFEFWAELPRVPTGDTAP
jgi:hypothetical protein